MIDYFAPVTDPVEASLRGTFEGIYPRFDCMHNRQRNLPLRAALESIDTDS